jgi:hypothetical protein
MLSTLQPSGVHVPPVLHAAIAQGQLHSTHHFAAVPTRHLFAQSKQYRAESAQGLFALQCLLQQQVQMQLALEPKDARR